MGGTREWYSLEVQARWRWVLQLRTAPAASRLSLAPASAEGGPVVAHLVRHPASTGCAIESAQVVVERGVEGWDLRYELRGDIAALELPVARLDPLRLWEHTCFELFAREPGATRYVEWNFSPTLQQSRFVFSRYRERVEVSDTGAATMVFERGARLLTLRVSAPLALSSSTRIGLCVVVRERSGATSYWALAHGGERPDFHAPEAFRQLGALGRS